MGYLDTTVNVVPAEPGWIAHVEYSDEDGNAKGVEDCPILAWRVITRASVDDAVADRSDSRVDPVFVDPLVPVPGLAETERRRRVVAVTHDTHLPSAVFHTQQSAADVRLG